MSPFTHLFTSWLVANAAKVPRRDRMLVTLAGLVPDVDAIGAVPELLTGGSDHALLWYSKYHHLLTHNVAFAATVGAAVFAAAVRRKLAAALALAAFHLHLVGDIVGSRGPDGYSWPIPYLAPFEPAVRLSWSGQWDLASWQNLAVTVAAMALTLLLAWSRGYSPVEMVSARADDAFVAVLRKWFPRG